MNLNSLFLASAAVGVAALALSAYAVWQMHSLNTLRKTFFSGSHGADLEDVIITLSAQLANLSDGHSTLRENLNALAHNSAFSVQKIGVVRFNPFNDGGGNLSFALAFLNGHNTGVVLTSMHGREQNRIYTKKITQGQSEVPLTDEEKQAIEMAG